MVAQNGQAGMVDADKVEGAKAAGLELGVKMQGPDGGLGYVAESKVKAARQANYSVTPDNAGAQKMVTPDGRITYALPSEVEDFQSTGHTKIAPDGRFEVKPLPGESNIDTMNRAINVGRALGPKEMERSVQAEKNWWTSKEGMKDEAAGLANVGIVGAETVGTITGGSEVLAAGKAGLQVLGETEAMQLLRSSPRLYAEYLLKNQALPALKTAAVEAIKHPLRTTSIVGGLGAAWHWLTSTK